MKTHGTGLLVLLAAAGMVFAGGLAGCKKTAEPAAKTYEWQTELVDAEAATPDRGSGPVQALLDAAGVLHVVYKSPPTSAGRIKYAQRTSDGWRTELVSGPASDGWHWPESLFLDAAGSPWLSSCDDSPAILLACRQGDRWENMVGARYGMNPRAVVDSRGYPHLTYWKPGLQYPSLEGLWHCWKDETGWRVEAVDDAVVGNEHCLAIAADDSLHVVYSTDGGYFFRYGGDPPGEDAVRYAVRRDGVWELSPIAAGCAYETEMVLDSLGRPHVAYTLDDKVYYAVLAEGTWAVEELPCPFPRERVAIALTADDQPLVAFVGFGGSSSDSLCLAARRDGQWEVQVIVERLYAPLTHVTLSVGPSGAFITYYTPDGFYCAVGK